MGDSDSAARRLHRFFAELRRRHVFRTTGVYIVAVWLLSQGVADLFPAFGLPDWTVRAFVVLGILGVPVVVFLAWAFDITPKGVQRDPGADYALDDTLITSDFGEAAELSPPYTVLASWTDEEDEERRRRFAHPFTLGREGDIAFSDKRVSRRHAQVSFHDGAWRVKDLDSANGTYLGGERIQEAALADSHEIRLHRRGPRIRLEIQAAD